MPKRFWAYEEGAAGANVLRLDGPIAEESWWGDEVTPAQFRQELAAHPGDLTVFINSPGGDVVAGSLIYGMLREHGGKITVRIDGLAASAASVVAMAGDRVEMAPTAYMMIHNAATIAFGDNREMRKAADMLDEINRGIRLAYQQKTGKSDRELAKMMDAETWMSAAKAIDEGFCDAICYGRAEEGSTSSAGTAATAATSVAQAIAEGLAVGTVSVGTTLAANGHAHKHSFGHTHSLPSHTHSLSNNGPQNDAYYAYQHALPAVAFAARDSQQLLMRALARATKPEPPKADDAARLRARLRLLSM